MIKRNTCITNKIIETAKFRLLCKIFIFVLFISFPGYNFIGKPIYASECECKNENEPLKPEYDNGILYDISGKKVDLKKIPARVVSLVPEISEIIEAVNPDYRLAGVTTHDINLSVAAESVIIGGFYSPDAARIIPLNPEIIFASNLHTKIITEFEDRSCRIISLPVHNADDVYRNIEIIGKLFHREQRAVVIIQGIKSKIENIQKKLQIIPGEKRLRAMRVMGFDGKKLGTPGDDSFQTEAIKLAGGIPIETGRNGQITSLSPGEWNEYDPQVIYGCGDMEKIWKEISISAGWNEAKAVKNKRMLVFPCNFTCRGSVNYGAFIEALSAALYGDYFFAFQPIRKDGFNTEKKINIEIPYIKSASIRYGTIDDFEQKTLVLFFTHKLDVLSTLTGWEKVDTAGNHYLCPPRWNDGHAISLKGLKKKICNAAGANPDTSSFLITGADMDNLAVIKKTYKDFTVYAMITAGIKSNAQRQSVDEGLYYPHGTINMLILTNTKLSSGAMARAIITATEAKTAVLQDFDIRSTYTPSVQATGTGTDNIIIVGGEGKETESTGGHTKMGELIAKAVYEGVVKAITMQNNIRSQRSVFGRLEERKISFYTIASNTGNIPPDRISKVSSLMADSLLDEDIAGFLETALASSDATRNSLISDNSLFKKWCLDIAVKISGKKVGELISVSINGEKENSPLSTAISAVLTGAVLKSEK